MKLPTAWSYSAYADYELCPAKFKYGRIDKLPQPDNPAFIKGREWHKKAEDFLRGLIELPKELRHFADAFTELRDMQPIVEQQWGFTSDWGKTGWFGNDTWFRAVVDAGVIYDDRTADIIDHKTGKMYKTNEDQVELFALAAMCRYPELTSVTARLWYLESGDEIIREFPAKDKDKLRSKWEKKVGPLFADRKWAPRPNDKCRWCAFSSAKGGPCKY